MMYILSSMTLYYIHFRTYSLERFKKTVDDFIQNGGESHNDTSFVYKCNVLDGTTEYVPPLYLLETRQFKRVSVEFKKT